MQRNQLFIALAATMCVGSSVNIAPIWAQEQRPVFYFQTPELKMIHAEGGAHLTWANSDAASKEAIFSQVQNAEGLTKITLDLDVAQSANTLIQIGFVNRYDNGFVYAFTPAESAPGHRTVEVPIENFVGNYTGPHRKGDEIGLFWVRLSGSATQFDATLSHFTLHATHDTEISLFDAAVKPNPFPPSFLYPGSQKPSFVGERKPRVMIAQGSPLLGKEEWEKGILKLSQEFPGSFGLDFNQGFLPGNKPVNKFYNDNGIKTVIETHKTVNQFTTYAAYNNFFLQNSKGTPGNISGPGLLFPYHGEDTTIPEIVQVSKEKIDEAAREGFSEFLLIDYIWPWNGRWGYGEHTVGAFRKDLSATDEGIFMSNGSGTYSKQGFWDYLHLFTDVPFTPTDMGLASWNDYSPVTETEASNGDLAKKKNIYLFHALWHYEYLKYAQLLGDYAATKGILFYPTVNGEDPMNGTDLYVMGNLRNVNKIGYEYFGSPGGTTGWYRTMRWYSGNFQEQGKDISMIGEINGGGNGPSRYSWDVAYGFYYDLTSSSKPIDYNNQYMEGLWTNTPKTDLYQFPRYAHWYAGALGFTQSHAERAALQPPKKTVLVASRGVLEYQPGFNSLTQTGNLAMLLDELHFPFDAAGKEGFAKFAKDAQNLVYCPSESSPMHMKDLKQWLSQGRGKTLIMQSLAPFSFSNGTLGLNPGLTSDLTWTGKANWNEFQKSETLSVNPDLAMTLSHVNNQTLTLTVDGQTVSAKRDVYELAKSPGVQTVLASQEGIPLISRLTRGANSILYIHARLNLPSFSAETDFDRLVLRKAMEMAGVVAEAQAPYTTTVHRYDVAGGHSAVFWDLPTIIAQDPKNYYARIALDQPAMVQVKVNANTPYTVYHFYDDHTQVVRSNAQGYLPVAMTHSNEIYYYGQQGDAAFEKTLLQIKATRIKLQKVEPEAAATDAVPFQTAAENAPNNARFLTFSGGMVLANRGLTDGTTITFKYREEGDSWWKTLGQRNFQNVYQDDQTLYALPLNGIHPKQIMAVVSMNGNPSFDATYLANLAITQKNGQAIQTFTQAQETGLVQGADNVADATQFQSSGAMFHYNEQDKLWVLHPAYNGAAVPAYSMFAVDAGALAR